MTKQFAKLNLDADKNFWGAIFDFSGKEGHANWSILPLDDCVYLSVSFEGIDKNLVPDSPAPAVTQEALCAKPLVNEESTGHSVAPIPQTRPPPPPTPSRKHPTTGAVAVAPKRRNITDASDDLREGKLDENCAFYDVATPASAQPSKGAARQSPKAVQSPPVLLEGDDEIEVVVDDESPSNAGAAAKSATRNLQAQFAVGKKLLQGGLDSDSEDDTRGIKKTKSAAKSSAGRSLLTRARVSVDSDDVDPPLRVDALKPNVRKAMESAYRSAQLGLEDSDDDTRVASLTSPAAKAKASAKKAGGSSDTSDSDGKETTKFASRWSKRAGKDSSDESC